MLAVQAWSFIVRRPQKLDLSSLSVLIIDDQPFFRTLLTEVLRNLGVLRVLVAVDGASGLSAFEEHRPDIVITDWIMPNVDGIAFTQKIRKHPIEARRQVPIILVTANTDRDKIEIVRACGIDEFILKPISTKAVIDRLTEVIERPRPFLTTHNYAGPCRRRRLVADFAGPYRRLEDPIEIDDGEKLQAGMKSVLRQAIQHASALVGALSPSAPNMKPIHLAVSEIQAIAEDVNDGDIDAISDLLLAEIVTANATRKVIPAVLQSYLDTIDALSTCAPEQRPQRKEITLNLNRLLSRPRAA